MTKAEIGVKRDCPECGARFYDLNKSPAICPKCHHEFIPEALLKPRKARPDDEAQEEKTDEPAPAAETSLEDADKEAKAAEPKRKATLDDEVDADDDDSDDELADIADIDDIDIDDDDDDDALLDDSDDDTDIGIVTTGDDDET